MRSAGLFAAVIAVAAIGCGSARPASPDDGGALDRTLPHFDALPPLDGAPAGYALRFDGVNDYATAGNGGFTPVAGTISVEMWIKIAGLATDQDFVVERMDLNSGFRVGIHAGTIAVRRVYVDRILAATPTPPSTNQWHHVAYTFDLTMNVLYVDGVAVDSRPDPTDTRTPTTAWLGSLDGSKNLFAGEMDEVRVWSTARTAAQVQADMQHGPVGPQAGLVAYWTFDDTEPGGRSHDQSGLGNDVTLGDGVVERMPDRVVSGAPL